MMDVNKFKLGMRRLASGVSLVTTLRDGERFGLTATAVSSLSATPPSLLVCVSQSASAHDHIVSSGILCVNVLSEHQEEHANRFASSRFRNERFDTGDWQALTTGSPALIGALASFDCKVRQVVPYESHTIFICEIVDVELPSSPRHPLVYLNSGYVRLGMECAHAVADHAVAGGK
jgi:flavin reductase